MKDQLSPKENASQLHGDAETEAPGQLKAAPPFQLMAGDAPPGQPKAATGDLPSDLITGFAVSTGHDLSDVKVHYNSSKPAKVGALAYAEGNDIYLAQGQEKHLGHEAAHLVQQREGRVAANTAIKGKAANTDPALESEADSMAEKAKVAQNSQEPAKAAGAKSASPGVVQRYTQPIVRAAPASAMTITRFIELVELEEAKYPAAEQTNTSLMITRIRKIFYGSPGWDSHLIRGVENVQSPYGAPSSRERSRRAVEVPGPMNDFDMVDTEYYPDLGGGRTPEIYRNQEVALETGSHAGIHCDVGHVLAGLDAFNHRHSVNALADIEIDNVEGTTWVGDLGSVLAEVQIDYVNDVRGGHSDANFQSRINEYAPAQDMLGNIDAYAIAGSYNIASTSGLKVSDILKRFYLGQGGDTNQNRRYTVFANGIGLTGWDGANWNNEADRITHYADQVNDAAAMYIGAGNGSSFTGWVSGRSFAVGMSMNGGSEGLVRAFFRSLKTARATEPV